MSFINNNLKIVSFIKFELGCKCPDEVFESIELVENFHNGNSLTVKLIVGNKLMVVFIRNENFEYTQQEVLNHLHNRIKERDRQGLNRVRVVFAIPDDADTLNIQKKYTDIDIDEKAHVHFINSSKLDIILAMS